LDEWHAIRRGLPVMGERAPIYGTIRSAAYLALIGNIFEETQTDLHDVSRRVTKLFHFVGGVIADQ
jgi:hypothetical protein